MAKCLECGFLAVRDEYNDLPAEAVEMDRRSGYHQNANGTTTDAKFFCYRKSEAFPCKSGDNIASKHIFKPKDRKELVATLGQEIDCGEFLNWHPGKHPKELEEMSLLQKVQDQQRQWRQEEIQRHARWREEDRKERQALEALYEQRHQEIRQEMQNETKSNYRTSILIAIVTLVASVLAAYLTIKFSIE